MFCFFVFQHIREGVDNLTWSLYFLTGEKFKKNPKYAHFFRFFGQHLKKSEKSKKIISGEKAQKCSRTFYAICFLCLCLSMCGEVLVTLLGHHKILRVSKHAKTRCIRGLSRCYPHVTPKPQFEVCFLRKKQGFRPRYAFSSWKSSS